MGKIWAVCSGSGGVGKSTVALSLAIGSAKAGQKTILLDASGISRSCDLVLKLESIVVLDMMDVIRDQISIETALYPVPQHPHLRFACASLYDDVPVSELSGMILALHTLCDVLVVDLPTGQCDLGRGVMQAGDERLLVTSANDASIRACERMMMRQSGMDQAPFSLIINRMIPERVKKKVQYPQETVQNLLDRTALACVLEDPNIPLSEQRGKSAIECDGPSKSTLNKLVKRLMGGT